SFALGPTIAQTGPAVRKDYSILEKHKKMLSQNADLLSIYDLISTKIIENILTKRSDPGN
ncbi:MAG: DUF2520 domain-containing protein, partial [Cytophagales bacterium]|nr:DUF2520 domain-containing protein [Cytophagales bacterium]